MPENSLGNALLGGLPIIGGIASSLLQRHWAKKDLEAQNVYNSPANQLKLLKEAGLPAVSYFAGGASAQSDQPRTTDVDLGTKELGKYGLNRLEKKQLEILDADVRLKNAEANLKEDYANFMLKPQMWHPEWPMNPEGDKLNVQSRQQHMLGVDFKRSGIGLIEQRKRTELVQKYLEEATRANINSTEMDSILKRITANDQNLFLDAKRDIIGALKENKRIPFKELIRKQLSMYLMRQ